MADKSFKEPPNAPNPVRTPDRKTTSLVAPWVFMRATPSSVGGIWASHECDGRRYGKTRAADGLVPRPPRSSSAPRRALSSAHHVHPSRLIGHNRHAAKVIECDVAGQATSLER